MKILPAALTTLVLLTVATSVFAGSNKPPQNVAESKAVRPSASLITGVPFVSWHEAALVHHERESTTNPLQKTRPLNVA
jgi:hypothetical protein